MTQEEKAQAYDEALEKAKIEINTKGIGEAVNLCYQLFPQLAENDDEESDDERIRKRLIEYFEGFRMGNAEVRWEGLIVQEVLAWLKKQKECVADNSKTSTDEDERIINQLITLVNSAGEVLLIPTNKEELVAWLNKYKESLHIPETCKENADSFTEDERIRQWLYDLVDEGAYLCERPFATESILAYLKRQKEQKHNYCLYGGYPNVGRCRWCYAACSARLADVHTDEEKEYIRTIKSIISDFIRDKKPENLAYYQRIYDWLDGRHVPFSCGHENGQPADPVFSKQEYESYPIISEDTTSAKQAEFDGKTLLYTADKSYQIGFRDGVASVKPAEWSESDKDVLMDAICATDKLGNDEVYNKNNPNLAKAFRVAKDWLKNLPERFNLQPKQERSEEDEKTYTFVCNYFETCWWSKTWDISREQVLKMLKSLHSQSKQEWKEEDEEMRDTCIDLLEHFPRPCGEVIGPWKDCISWLKSLRPQPKQEWSEENEKDVAHIIRILDDCYAYGKHDLSKTDHENLVGTLKSLRLQPKLEWSEEDEHRRDGIIQWLREYQAKFNLKYDSLSIESIESLIDWFKSLRPSWKPNEEQMEALDKARRFIPYNCDALESLYVDLKKL